MTVKLADYRSVVAPAILNEIEALSHGLQGRRIQHINTTAVGGGVAEILKRLVPLMEEVGLTANWSVMQGTPAFFEVTKAFHNAFHGQPVNITDEMLEIYRQVTANNLKLIDSQANFVVLHDQQTLGLSEARTAHRGKWLWYCHIDPVDVNPKLWEFLSSYAKRCDGAIYHLPEYAKGLLHSQYILPPAIDPLSEKNRDLNPGEAEAVMGRLGLTLNKPMVLQVSRFDRLKDPLGVIEAFRLVRKVIDCQLVLAGGGAADDPEGAAVLAEVQAAARGNKDIHVMELPPTSDLEINVLQRSAAVIVQKSLREGFGLTATEALWKGRPLVATAVGGLSRQVIHRRTGLLVHSIEGTARAIYELLANPNWGQKLGQAGQEYVRRNFTIPVYLRSWLAILRAMQD